MNSLVERFSTTGAAADIRRARQVLGEEEDGPDVMSFGNLASGVPKFHIPAVPDVRGEARICIHLC